MLKPKSPVRSPTTLWKLGALVIGLGLGFVTMEQSLGGAACQHRPNRVTYGGLAPRAGYERDHRVPLCLGGPDTRDNVWYEPLAEAHEKDIAERNACRHACALGPRAIASTREDFATGNWRKWR